MQINGNDEQNTNRIKLPEGELTKNIETSGDTYLRMIHDNQKRHEVMKEKLETSNSILYSKT